MDNFIEGQRAVTIQANQETNTVESSLDKKLDGFQSKIDQKLDILYESISKLTNQLVHQEEENPEEECQSETMVEEPCLQQPQEGLVENFESSVGAAVCLWEKKEATSPLLTEDSSGKEEGEEPHEPIIQPNPIDLDPNATTQLKNNPLPVAPSADQVYILSTPTAKSKPAAPAPKTHASPSLLVQHFKRFVATVQTFATTSKKMAAAHTAWHSGWFGCRFEFGAPEPRHF